MYIKDVDHLGNWQCQVSLQISLEITVIPLHFCSCYSILLIILPLVYSSPFLKLPFTCTAPVCPLPRVSSYFPFVMFVHVTYTPTH